MDIFDRINEALYSQDADEALEALQKEGLFLNHVPEVQGMVGFGGADTGMKDLWSHTKRVVVQTDPRPLLRWAALFHDVGKIPTFSRKTGKIAFHGHEASSARLFDRAARRIGVPNNAREEIRFLVASLGLVEGYEPEWTVSAIRRLLKDVGPHFESLLALSRADITTKHDYKRDAHHKRIQELADRASKVRQEDAIPPALPTGLGTAITAVYGIPEGRELGDIVRALKAAVEAGELPRQADMQVYLDVVRDRLSGTDG